MANPKPEHDFIWERPPEQWDDGVMLGNGRIGAVLWGAGEPLRVTLDKYDLWEVRGGHRKHPEPGYYTYENMKRQVREQIAAAERGEQYVPPYGSEDKTAPPWHASRLPTPRMEIDGLDFHKGRLLLSNATWDAGDWQACIHADHQILVFRGPAIKQARVRGVAYPNPALQAQLRKWEYPEPAEGETGGVSWWRQDFPFDGSYVVAWTKRADALLVAMVSHRDADDPLTEAVDLVSGTDLDALIAEHAAWWRGYWEQTPDVSLPDSRMESLFYAEMYKLGSSVRADGLPISLQGVWTPDGHWPAWNGDYHLDANVQGAYWPVYTSNHLDLGMSLYDMFDEMLPRFRERCREFFGFDGAWSGVSVGIPECQGGARGNWICGPWQFMPSNLAWIAHHYWLHYRYSLDKDFLRERALPMLKDTWRVYKGLLEEEADGKLHLPLTVSPEYGEPGGSHEGEPPLTPWVKDTSCDAAIIRFLCHALIETDDLLDGKDPDRARYEEILEKLYDYPGGDEFWVADGVPLTHSHRHHSHLMAIHPFGLVSIEGSDEDRARIEKSLFRIRELGTGEWGGWMPFPWMSMIGARASKGEMAWHMLDMQFRCIQPNSLSSLGQTRNFGILRYGHLPGTLEGGFSAAAAIMEILLQSWNGIIRVFPAVPEFWGDISFHGLLAEGAVLVSAAKRDGAVQRVELTSRFGGAVRLRNPFGGDALVDGKPADDAVIRVETQPGTPVRVTPAQAPAGTSSRRAERPQGNWFGLKRIPKF